MRIANCRRARLLQFCTVVGVLPDRIAEVLLDSSGVVQTQLAMYILSAASLLPQHEKVKYTYSGEYPSLATHIAEVAAGEF